MSGTKSPEASRPNRSPKGQPKPELTREEAAYLVNKLDQPIECSGHQDRNSLQIVIQKLVQIAQWKEGNNEQDSGGSGSGKES
jgi:hypothetical protein